MLKHGVQGSELELEATETAAMNDPDMAVSQLNLLRELGIWLAIDNFGTGYSSLAYMKRLPIQTLKLDRMFVRDIESDPSDVEISLATIVLAHNLGLWQRAWKQMPSAPFFQHITVIISRGIYI
jgi:EAL domain-containing protein (putative c-di-GMP-specific phosphodiesterase class I)